MNSPCRSCSKLRQISGLPCSEQQPAGVAVARWTARKEITDRLDPVPLSSDVLAALVERTKNASVDNPEMEWVSAETTLGSILSDRGNKGQSDPAGEPMGAQ